MWKIPLGTTGSFLRAVRILSVMLLAEIPVLQMTKVADCAGDWSSRGKEKQDPIASARTQGQLRGQGLPLIFVESSDFDAVSFGVGALVETFSLFCFSDTAFLCGLTIFLP